MSNVEFVKLDCGITVPVLKQEVAETEPSFFISVGEYPVYDTKSYEFMQEDKEIENAYITALKKYVKNKNVLDIGTGEYLDWAAYAVDYGAKSSVGVEVIKETYEKALINREEHPEKEKITLVNAFSQDYTPEEKFDVIVSEIIGTIGSSEGVISVLNDAKRRLLKEDGVMIPYICNTLCGLVSANDLIGEPKFHPDSIEYLNQIFKNVGHPMDVRLTFDTNYPESLMSTYEVVESLNFSNDFNFYSESAFKFLKITKTGQIDGILLWLNLYVDKDQNTIDTLFKKSRWENVYFPLFDEPINVNEGDVAEVMWIRTLADDKVHLKLS